MALIYCGMMKTESYRKREIATKIALISLGLLLSVCLFVTGSIASESCGIDSHRNMQYSGKGQVQCLDHCSTGNTHNDCASHCSPPVELPKVAVVSNGGFNSDSFGLTVTPIKAVEYLFDPDGNPSFQSLDKPYVTLPIFLQNQSFLI